MSFLPPATPAGRSRRQASIRANLHQASGPLVANILATFERATPDELSAGTLWYWDAHGIAADLTPGDPHRGAGILAALSPQVSWPENVRAAHAVLRGEDPPCLPLSVDRARAILQGASPEATLGGRKVRSFYRNIHRPDIGGAVTVDRHAVAIATGVRDITDRRLERPGVYVAIAGAYRTAARRTALLPHELQAVTWLTHRRELDESNARGIRSNLLEDF